MWLWEVCALPAGRRNAVQLHHLGFLIFNNLLNQTISICIYIYI